ncbi:MAG: hypothetical protein ABSG59_13605 [Verrucomicrobiota bacterium]|jgi:hypothetical protein
MEMARTLNWLICITGAFAALGASDDGFVAGPAYAKFRLTLTSGWREEASGPLFYWQQTDEQQQWALPPFYCHTRTPDVDWTEWDLLYPVIDYRRFGPEYRLQIAQFVTISGGHTEEENSVSRFTVFPVYFQQRSAESNLEYTAVAPFYGHLKNRLFRDDIKFLLFPLYSETRKKDVVTDNYLYPIFDVRHGLSLTGWQIWPLAGAEHRGPTLRTNLMNEVETVGGYDKYFALWPIYFNSHGGLGTTNPASSVTVVPFYSQTRSPSRDETSYGWPLGYNCIADREKGYVEHDVFWPLFVRARGSKTVTRYFPIYSRARSKSLESDFYAWPIYKFNRLESAPLDRHRVRVGFFLYSDTVERNTSTGEKKRRVDCWPFYTFERDLDGNRRLQAMALLEPFFPNNRTMRREYSPIWTVWRSEKNGRTGATSQSLLWNLYRHEKAGEVKKSSLLFGLFQYQSTLEGARRGMCYGQGVGKTAPSATKS